MRAWRRLRATGMAVALAACAACSGGSQASVREAEASAQRAEAAAARLEAAAARLERAIDGVTQDAPPP